MTHKRASSFLQLLRTFPLSDSYTKIAEQFVFSTAHRQLGLHRGLCSGFPPHPQRLHSGLVGNHCLSKISITVHQQQCSEQLNKLLPCYGLEQTLWSIWVQMRKKARSGVCRSGGSHWSAAERGQTPFRDAGTTDVQRGNWRSSAELCTLPILSQRRPAALRDPTGFAV